MIADRGYDHDKYRHELWRRGVKPVIPSDGWGCWRTVQPEHARDRAGGQQLVVRCLRFAYVRRTANEATFASSPRHHRDVVSRQQRRGPPGVESPDLQHLPASRGILGPSLT